MFQIGKNGDNYIHAKDDINTFGYIPHFKDTAAVLAWLGEHADTAEVDGETVIVPNVYVAYDYCTSAVRIDLGTHRVYKLTGCIFNVLELDTDPYIFWGSMGYPLEQFKTAEDLKKFIDGCYAETHERWKREYWTPTATIEDDTLVLRNVTYIGRTERGYEKGLNLGTMKATFVDGTFKGEWTRHNP